MATRSVYHVLMSHVLTVLVLTVYALTVCVLTGYVLTSYVLTDHVNLNHVVRIVPKNQQESTRNNEKLTVKTYLSVSNQTLFCLSRIEHTRRCFCLLRRYRRGRSCHCGLLCE